MHRCPRVLAACLIIVPSLLAAEEKVLEPLNNWSGMLVDPGLRQHAPKTGFINTADNWKKLWQAWRPDERLPKVDFKSSLVLVGTVNGPNLVIMRPVLDDTGDVKYIVAGTRRGGPGFGYRFIQINRDGVKTIRRKPLNQEKNAVKDSIRVEVTGKLTHGIVAIGGETTGSTITANGITWELFYGPNLELNQAADRLNGKQVRVTGSLERRQGVEVRVRWIVTVERLEETGAGKED